VLTCGVNAASLRNDCEPVPPGGHYDDRHRPHPQVRSMPAIRVCQSQPGSTRTAQAISGPIATTSALYLRICL
jgi:hypothetical protein